MSDPPTDPRVSLLPQPDTPAPIQPMSGGSMSGGATDPTVSLLPQPSVPTPIQPMSGGGTTPTNPNESLLPQPTEPVPIVPVQGGGAGDELRFQTYAIPDPDKTTLPDFLKNDKFKDYWLAYSKYRFAELEKTHEKKRVQDRGKVDKIKWVKEVNIKKNIESYVISDPIDFLVAVNYLVSSNKKDSYILFILNNKTIDNDNFQTVYMYFLKTAGYFYTQPTDNQNLDCYLLFDYSTGTSSPNYKLDLEKIQTDLEKSGSNFGTFALNFRYMEPFYIQANLLDKYVLIFTYRIGVGNSEFMDVNYNNLKPLYVNFNIIEDKDAWLAKQAKGGPKAGPWHPLMFDLNDTTTGEQASTFGEIIDFSMTLNKGRMNNDDNDNSKKPYSDVVIPIEWQNIKDSFYIELNYKDGLVKGKETGDLDVPLVQTGTKVVPLPFAPKIILPPSTQQKLDQQKKLAPVVLERSRYVTITLNGQQYRITDPSITLDIEKVWNQGKVQDDERRFLESIGYTEDFYKSQLKEKSEAEVNKDLSLFLSSLALNNCNNDTQLLLKSECNITRDILMKIYLFKQSNFLKKIRESVTGSKRISETGELILTKFKKPSVSSALPPQQKTPEELEAEKRIFQAFQSAIRLLTPGYSTFPLITPSSSFIQSMVSSTKPPLIPTLQLTPGSYSLGLFGLVGPGQTMTLSQTINGISSILASLLAGTTSFFSATGSVTGTGTAAAGTGLGGTPPPPVTTTTPASTITTPASTITTPASTTTTPASTTTTPASTTTTPASTTATTPAKKSFLSKFNPFSKKPRSGGGRFSQKSLTPEEKAKVTKFSSDVDESVKQGASVPTSLDFITDKNQKYIKREFDNFKIFTQEPNRFWDIKTNFLGQRDKSDIHLYIKSVIKILNKISENQKIILQTQESLNELKMYEQNLARFEANFDTLSPNEKKEVEAAKKQLQAAKLIQEKIVKSSTEIIDTSNNVSMIEIAELVKTDLNSKIEQMKNYIINSMPKVLNNTTSKAELKQESSDLKEYNFILDEFNKGIDSIENAAPEKKNIEALYNPIKVDFLSIANNIQTVATVVDTVAKSRSVSSFTPEQKNELEQKLNTVKGNIDKTISDIDILYPRTQSLVVEQVPASSTQSGRQIATTVVSSSPPPPPVIVSSTQSGSQIPPPPPVIVSSTQSGSQIIPSSTSVVSSTQSGSQIIPSSTSVVSSTQSGSQITPSSTSVVSSTQSGSQITPSSTSVVSSTQSGSPNAVEISNEQQENELTTDEKNKFINDTLGLMFTEEITTNEVEKNRFEKIEVPDDGWCFYYALLYNFNYDDINEKYDKILNNNDIKNYVTNVKTKPKEKELFIEKTKNFIIKIKNFINNELKNNNRFNFLIKPWEKEYQEQYNLLTPEQKLKYKPTYTDYINDLEFNGVIPQLNANATHRMFAEPDMGIGFSAAYLLKARIRIYTYNSNEEKYFKEREFFDPLARSQPVVINLLFKDKHYDILLPTQEDNTNNSNTASTSSSSSTGEESNTNSSNIVSSSTPSITSRSSLSTQEATEQQRNNATAVVAVVSTPAAEQAAKVAAEEAAKVAAEQAAKVAAEQAAKEAAEKVTAEEAAKEAAKVAAEQAAKEAAEKVTAEEIKDEIDDTEKDVNQEVEVETTQYTTELKQKANEDIEQANTKYNEIVNELKKKNFTTLELLTESKSELQKIIDQLNSVRQNIWNSFNEDKKQIYTNSKLVLDTLKNIITPLINIKNYHYWVEKYYNRLKNNKSNTELKDKIKTYAIDAIKNLEWIETNISFFNQQKASLNLVNDDDITTAKSQVEEINKMNDEVNPKPIKRTIAFEENNNNNSENQQNTISNFVQKLNDLKSESQIIFDTISTRRKNSVSLNTQIEKGEIKVNVSKLNALREKQEFINNKLAELNQKQKDAEVYFNALNKLSTPDAIQANITLNMINNLLTQVNTFKNDVDKIVSKYEQKLKSSKGGSRKKRQQKTKKNKNKNKKGKKLSRKTRKVH
jgi:hypothetical protein